MSRANPTLVGSFVLGGVALAVAAAIALGAQGLSSHTQPFVVQLEGTANGLRVGAPVKFKGVQVGSVDRIAIRVMAEKNDLPIAVFCSVDDDRILAASVGNVRKERPTVRELVCAGLRARLETESLVTGVCYIATSFAPDDPGTTHGDVGDIPEVPSLSSQTEVFESAVERILAQLQDVDLAGLVEEGKRAVKSIGDIGSSPEARSAIGNLDQTLTRLRAIADDLDRSVPHLVDKLGATSESADALAKNLDAGVAEARETITSARRLIDHLDEAVGPFTTSLSTAATDVGGAARSFTDTLGGLDQSTSPNAPLIVQLQASLAELAGAARAARSLLEQLDREPSQLLRGRGEKEGGTR